MLRKFLERSQFLDLDHCGWHPCRLPILQVLPKHLYGVQGLVVLPDPVHKKQWRLATIIMKPLNQILNNQKPVGNPHQEVIIIWNFIDHKLQISNRLVIQSKFRVDYGPEGVDLLLVELHLIIVSIVNLVQLLLGRIFQIIQHNQHLFSRETRRLL